METSTRSIVYALGLISCGAFCLCALTACAPQVRATSPTVAVIVHPTNQTGELSDTALRAIFSKEQLEWPPSAGLPRNTIIAIDLGPDDPARATFSQRVFGKSTAMVRRSWIAERLKSGREPPPQRSAAEVLDIVSRAPGAIGYIPASMATDRVKVIRTL